MVKHHKYALDHDDGSVNDNPEINRAHRKQIGRHSAQFQTDERKQQRQRNNDAHDDGGAPVSHEQKHNHGHEQNPLGEVVQHGFGAVGHQVIAVIKRDHLHVGRQNFVVEFADFGLHPAQHLRRIFAFALHNDSLHHVVAFVQANLPHTRLIRLDDLRHVAHQHGQSALLIHDNVLNIRDIGQQPDTAHDIRLPVFFDHVAPHVQVILGHGVINFRGSKPVFLHLHRVHHNLVGFFAPAEGHNIGHARHGPQLAVNHPVLNRKQFAGVARFRLERIAENLTRRAVRRLNIRLYAFGQRDTAEEVVDLLPGKKVLDVILENNFHHRQAEHGDGTDVGFALHRVHGDLNRHRHKPLHFFGRAAIPFRDHNNLGVGHVGESLDGRIKVAENTGDGECADHEKHEKRVFQRKRQDGFYEVVHQSLRAS